MINIIALAAMFLDHIGIVLFPDMIIFRIIGRLSFPLFAWGIARGYRFTSNFKIYAARLLLLAIISQLPFYLLFNNENLNICFTLFIGLLVLKLFDSSLNIYTKIPFIIILLIASQILQLEYGFYGILTILIFYCFWDKDSVVFYQAILTLLAIIVLRYDPIELFAVLSPIIILFLNLLQKKDLKLNKFFRYSFYPLHLCLLFLIKIGGFIK